MDLTNLPLHRQLGLTRKAHQVTQQTLAQRVGLSEEYISSLEAGRRRLTDELFTRLMEGIQAESRFLK